MNNDLVMVLQNSPLPSTGHRLSCDDWRISAGKLSELFCTVLCAAVVRNDT